jgi:hypothetical protein
MKKYEIDKGKQFVKNNEFYEVLKNTGAYITLKDKAGVNYTYPIKRFNELFKAV